MVDLDPTLLLTVNLTADHRFATKDVYVGATFLYTLDTEFFPHSRIIPKPLVRIISRGDTEAIFETRDMKPKDLFGAVLGMSIINKHKNTTLNLETRLIDQNAFAFVGTLRF